MLTRNFHVGGTLKTLILDHVYVKDIEMINNIASIKPIVGNHLLITFDISFDGQKLIQEIKRSWQSYSKEKY